jgi:hypothetical protein
VVKVGFNSTFDRSIERRASTLATATKRSGIYLALSSYELDFVKEYCKDLDVKAAAERLGYDESLAEETGFELLARDQVQTAIAARLIDLNSQPQAMMTLKPADYGVTEGYVLLGLKRLAEDPDFKKVTSNVKVKAYELMGKHIGMFQDKLTVTAQATVNGFDDATRQEIIRRVNDKAYGQDSRSNPNNQVDLWQQ